MPDQKLLYLSQSEVALLGVTMREIIDALEVAFREAGNGRVYRRALERGVGSCLPL